MKAGEHARIAADTAADTAGKAAAVSALLCDGRHCLLMLLHRRSSLKDTASWLSRYDGVAIEDLSLDFTYPGFPEVLLTPGG